MSLKYKRCRCLLSRRYDCDMGRASGTVAAGKALRSRVRPSGHQNG